MREYLKNNLAKHLKQLLLDKQMTQAELSRLTGISTSTINDYVNGRSLISKRNEKSLESILKIDVTKLYSAPVMDNMESSDVTRYGASYYQIESIITLQEQDVFENTPFKSGDTLIIVKSESLKRYYCYRFESKYIVTETQLSNCRQHQLGYVIGLHRK